jgi:hypothetical protein
VANKHKGPGPYGGDEKVDRDGVSTENHLEMWRRLVKDGPHMHGTPGERKKKTH